MAATPRLHGQADRGRRRASLGSTRGARAAWWGATVPPRLWMALAVDGGIERPRAARRRAYIGVRRGARCIHGWGAGGRECVRAVAAGGLERVTVGGVIPAAPDEPCQHVPARAPSSPGGCNSHRRRRDSCRAGRAVTCRRAREGASRPPSSPVVWNASLSAAGFLLHRT